MARTLDIACLQTRPMATMAEAIDEAIPMAKEAVDTGADMLFLPEYCGGLATDGPRVVPPSAREDRHEVLAALRDFAKQHRVWVNIGSIAVDAPDGKIINRGYMIDAAGEIFGHYDKIHLFDVALDEGHVYRESDCVQPGSVAANFETPLGSIGHVICYDLRFPGLFRDLARAGAEVLACPAAFTRTTGEAHWHVLNRARAIENTCFVVSACAVGPVAGGGESYGHSLIVDPWGVVLADGGTAPGVVHASLDLDLVGATSARIPSLNHGRDYTISTFRQKKDVA
ncbi:MAG: carbon-nitrogen hydrolase family protein [Silicimonas sp.]|nr:carbon-nitrogen hydrolase family protein [Silicimonas sp.]